MSLGQDYLSEHIYEKEKGLNIMAIGEVTNVTTGEVRLSFVHLFKPYAFQAGQDEKYSVTILLPKTDTATKARIDAAIQAAKQKGANGTWNGVVPPVVPDPMWDGDGVKQDGTPFGDECKGHWVFTARSNPDYPPEVVDQFGNPIINHSDVYSGCYALVNIEFYPYNFNGKKGVGCSLGPVKKMRDGEALGGSAPTAAQAFGAPTVMSATGAPLQHRIDPITGQEIPV